MPRVADGELAARMAAIGAVLVEGAKATGKTETAVQIAATTWRFDVDANARTAVRLNPDALFDNPTPVLFDEWQREPEVWDLVRRAVDDRGGKGLFVLTGSATPRDDDHRHSGAGRIGTVRMRPMSLYESGHSTGQVSLAALLDGQPSAGRGAGLGVPGLVERIVVGGWPSLIGADQAQARAWLADYLDMVASVDLPTLGPRRNPGNVLRLMEALGRSVAQPVRLTALAADVGGDAGPVATQTLTGYLDALDRLMLTDNSEAWSPHMRSRTRLRTAPVRYFTDPSLGVAALGVGTDELLADLNATGLHFEALAMRDLRVYAQPLGGTVSSWRDSNGREVDAVMTLPGRRWAAFEVKLDASRADDAAASLRSFADSVDTTRHGLPAALVVITGTGYPGTRPDGVHVVPVDALGP